jgi:glycosyltransferase involved in cell wall biosynthesis
MQESPLHPVVLQVLPALGGGGVERGTVEIAQAIALAGGTPLVASAGGMLAAGVERAGGHNIALPLATKNPLSMWRNAGQLEKIIRTHRVDLVHARSRAPAWSAYWATRRTHVPFVTTYHGAYNENFPAKRAYNAVMAKGDIVIAISEFIRERIERLHRIDPSQIRVIPRGVDPTIFDPDRVSPDRMMKLSRAWRLEDGQPLVLLPGRLTRWKGQTVLIEALSRMSNRDVTVVLVGSAQGRTQFEKELVDLAQARGVGQRVRIVGHCDDMPAALKMADVVVNASTDPEAFGRVVIEAQSMGCPVVGTDHGGAVETIADNETGWRVKPGDAGELAEVLDFILGLTVEQRSMIGAAARLSVQQNYTTRRMQAATIAVYQELLEGSSGVWLE